MSTDAVGAITGVPLARQDGCGMNPSTVVQAYPGAEDGAALQAVAWSSVQCRARGNWGELGTLLRSKELKTTKCDAQSSTGSWFKTQP